MPYIHNGYRVARFINRTGLTADNTRMTIAAGPISVPVEPLKKLERLCAAAKAVRVSPLTIRNRPEWDNYVCGHPQGTLFHSIAWMESVGEVFKHKPHYLMAWQGRKVVGILPLFQVDSLLGGRMLVSVPYGVGGGMVASTAQARKTLWNSACNIAREIRANSIDLRSEVPLVEMDNKLNSLVDVDQYVGFKKELPDGVGDVLGWLPRKARAAARNARDKHGLTTEFNHDYLFAVWKLYCRSMRRLGSICYPYSFFEALVERNRKNTHVQVVRSKDRVIAGLVSFIFRDECLPYFVGCDERFNRFNANNFLYWKSMERAVETGCRIYDFGRTRKGNKGSYDFKRFHGFTPRALGYQRLVCCQDSATNLTPANPRLKLVRELWKKMPEPVCTRLGMWLSYHIPG